MQTPARLESWKEIAAYLKRDVRTVQRWEAFESLPVHRHLHKKRGSVYAIPSELDAWRETRSVELFTPANGDGAASGMPPIAEAGARPIRMWMLALTGIVASLVVVTWRTWNPAPVVQASAPVDAPRLFGESFREGASIERIDVGSDVYDLVLSPDESTLFATTCGPQHHELIAIDVKTRAVAWRLSDFKTCSLLVASGRGDRLYFADNPDIVMVDVGSRAVKRIRTPAARLNDLAISRDDRAVYVAAVYDGLLKLDTRSGEVTTVSKLTCPMRLAMAPDTDRLYVNYQCQGPGGRRGHDSVEVFDTRTDKSVGVITGFANVGGQLAVTPDGSQLWVDGADACIRPQYDAVGCPEGDGAIVNVIRTSDHTLLRSLRVGPPGEFGVQITFSPDGSRAILGDKHATIVGVATLTELESHPEPLRTVVFSHDGRVAFAVLGDTRFVTVLPIAPHPLQPPGLTARWPFDGVGTDAAGSNDIPLEAGAFGSGLIGQAADLNRHLSIRLNVPTNLDLERGQFTITAWAKPAPSAAGGAMTLVEYVLEEPGGSAQFGWVLRQAADGGVEVCAGHYQNRQCDAAKAAVVRGRERLAPGQWHHLAITRLDESFTLYVNGKVAGTGNISGGMRGFSPSWLRLGSDEAGSAPFEGRLDEVEIYNRALTLDEILARGK